MTKKLIALALAMVACGVRAEGVSEAQVRAALQVQSSAYSLRPMCDPNYLAKQEREVNGTISRGDFVNASAREHPGRERRRLRLASPGSAWPLG